MRPLARAAIALAALSAVLWGVSLFRVHCRIDSCTLALWSGEFSFTTMPTYLGPGLGFHGFTLRDHRWWPRRVDGWFWVYPGDSSQWIVRTPLWAPTLVFSAAGAATVLLHRRRERRRAATHCPACNYPRDAARLGPCPECGAVPPRLPA